MTRRTSKQSESYEPVGGNVSIFARHGWWHANYQLDGRQRRTALKTRSKREARRRAAQLDADLLAGKDPRRKPAPTVAEVRDKYLAYLRTEGRRPKTMTKYTAVLQGFVDLCAELHVGDISRLGLTVVDEHRSRRVKEKQMPKTVYTETVVIRQLINFALSRKMITEDPLTGLRLRKPKPTRQPCWTPAEVDRILIQATGPARSCFEMLRETGLRVGELIHLTWDDVDFDRGFVHVRAKDGWQPKTGDERSIPVSPALRATLAALSRHGRWVVTMPSTRTYPQLDRRISDRWLLYQLKRILKRLGLAGHVHTFRHSFISHALTSGTPESIVRQWVGHVDPEILKVYTHVADDISRRAMDRLHDRSDDEDEGLQPAGIAG